MGDEPIVISSGLVITPESVASRSFATAFRGYHPAEVRQFLKRVSDELAAGAGREVELRRALQEALARAAHPELDEATVTNVLGEHAARLIASARDTAASITSDAQQRADGVRREVEQRVARMREEADGLLARRMAEAESAGANVQHAGEAEARAVREQARTEAEATLEAARAHGKEMISEARALRERMLGDLARRRRAAQVQIEQLRAARDRLLAAYAVVRRTLDEATQELTAAEPEARMAAEAVARRAEESDMPVRAAERSSLWGPEGPPSSRLAATGLTPPENGDRALSLVATRPEPPARHGGPASVSPPPRRSDQVPAPAVPQRPPLRPQAVADAVSGRPGAMPVPAVVTPAVVTPAVVTPTPTPAAIAAPAPAIAPRPEPAALPAPASAPESASATASELSTGEVPAIGAQARPTSKVEELFARIRADRGVDDAGVVGDQAPVEPVPGQPEAGVDHRAGPAPEATPDAAEAALEGRDDLLDNVEAGLMRALKRVLQDEQNEVLDNLRRLGASSPDAVLPEADAQAGRYRDAALPWLHQATRAGVGFVSDPSPGSSTEAPVPAADAQARRLADELAAPLRQRLVRSLADDEGTADPAVAAESLRGSYRQWKTQQVEDLARHHAVAAFSEGAFAATPDGTILEWLVDDDGPCPDCDDNALAGPTPKGRPFPTGQLHPPAHFGCRCLLAPIGSPPT